MVKIFAFIIAGLLLRQGNYINAFIFLVCAGLLDYMSIIDQE